MVYKSMSLSTCTRNYHSVHHIFDHDIRLKDNPVAIDGLNEYLSALMAVGQLQDHLPKELLLQIICYIQATTPFYQPDP